ncbi:MAG: antitoxin MazE family protein [Cyanobium sp.]
MPSSANQPSSAPVGVPEERRAANRRKVREHRQRLRAQGMRPIQIWVPDVHAPEFAAEARRQCLLANASEEEAEIQAFIDSVYEWPDDETSQ